MLIVVHQCSSAVTIQLQDASNTAQTPVASTVVHLTSNTTGRFAVYSDSGCTAVLSSGNITFTTADSAKTVYIKDTLSSTPAWTLDAIRMSGDGLTSAAQAYTLTTGFICAAPGTSNVTPASIVLNPGTSDTITLKDCFGNAETGIPAANILLQTDPTGTVTQPNSATNSSGQTTGSISWATISAKRVYVSLSGQTLVGSDANTADSDGYLDMIPIVVVGQSTGGTSPNGGLIIQ
jgi:hypothetical protein